MPCCEPGRFFLLPFADVEAEAPEGLRPPDVRVWPLFCALLPRVSGDSLCLLIVLGE